MRIIYFVNRSAKETDIKKRDEFRKAGNKIVFSDGSFKNGFEDSCDAVYLSSDFPHIEKWAQSRGILVMRPEPEPQPEPEVKPYAETHSERTEEETQTDEEVKPKQRRTRRAKPDNDPSDMV